MLPITPDNGSRLAAILPTCLTSIAIERGFSGSEVLAGALGVEPEQITPQIAQLLTELPKVRSVVVIVVDGLGYSNLKTLSAHARTLSAMNPKRIETVVPSTTGAALTTITTGRLPGMHGLLGYQIKHPELGLVSTLKGWDSIVDTKSWQRSATVFRRAKDLNIQSIAIGRPAHSTSGLSASILDGAEYRSGQTMVDRFAIASQLARRSDPFLGYLYIDELDKAAHSYGWQSRQWSERLELFDAALQDFLNTLPKDVGVVVTADHGIIDAAQDKQVLLDIDREMTQGVVSIGGEPRLRSLYLDPELMQKSPNMAGEASAFATEVAQRFHEYLGKRAWVGTREEAISAGWFGKVDPRNVDRLGEVIIAARSQYAFYSSADSQASRMMVGQHGSITDEERGVPLAFGGVFANSVLGALIAKTAAI